LGAEREIFEAIGRDRRSSNGVFRCDYRFPMIEKGRRIMPTA
jgi:hypothetical protein